MNTEEMLNEILAIVRLLAERPTAQQWYTTEQFARMVGKAEFTVREWCRLGRIRAEKQKSGRGAHRAWAVSHEELLRYQREGLLPDSHTRNEI